MSPRATQLPSSFLLSPRSWPAVLAVFFLGSAVPTPAQPEDPDADPVATDLRMPDLDRSALVPEKRDPTEVTDDERNPFGFVAPASAPDRGAIETESEEDKLRRILAGMRVTGTTTGSGANAAVLGPILIREGENLPRMFSDQAEILRVESITDRKVVLVFIDTEKVEGKEARTLELPVDLEADVRSMMPGEVFQSLVDFDGSRKVNLPPIKSGSTAAFIERVKAEDVQLQSLVEREIEFMGGAVRSPKTGEEDDEAAVE